MIIRRIGVASVAKVAGAIYAAFGLLFGALVSLLTLAGAGFAARSDAGSGLLGIVFGVAAVVLFPIFYGILGAVFSAIGAVIYNIFAGVLGGVAIEVELEQSDRK